MPSASSLANASLAPTGGATGEGLESDARHRSQDDGLHRAQPNVPGIEPRSALAQDSVQGGVHRLALHVTELVRTGRIAPNSNSGALAVIFVSLLGILCAAVYFLTEDAVMSSPMPRRTQPLLTSRSRSHVSHVSSAATVVRTPVPPIREPLIDVQKASLLSLSSKLPHRSVDSQELSRSNAKQQPPPGSTFCPSLVVPEGHECHLVIPIRVGHPMSHGPFSITDVNNNIIFTAEAQAGTYATFGRSHKMTDWVPSEQLLIRGSTSGQLRLRCIPLQAGPGVPPTYLPDGQRYPKVFHIMRDDSDTVARLDCGVEESRCELTTSIDSRKTLFHPSHGDFTQNKMAVVEPDDLIIATTSRGDVPFHLDRSRPCYTVRMAENVDAGLILGALLCIDWWLATLAISNNL